MIKDSFRRITVYRWFAKNHRRHPELQDVINRMMATLDTDTMRELNYQVDVEHKSPKEVAHDFLVAKGLVK